ncbi:MAG: hypothetical protein GKR86_00110 [Ilumatobacter sp.]|nr:hypothetical protein [Ilumatobacter sp.]
MATKDHITFGENDTGTAVSRERQKKLRSGSLNKVPDLRREVEGPKDMTQPVDNKSDYQFPGGPEDITGYGEDGSPIYQMPLKIGGWELESRGGRMNAQGIPVDKEGEPIGPYKILGDHFMNFGMKYGDIATLGLARPLGGLRGAMQGAMDPEQTAAEGWREGYDQNAEILQEASDELDPVTGGIATGLGLLGPGATAAADKVIGKQLTKIAPTRGQHMARLGATGASAATATFLDNYLIQGMDLDQAMLQTGVDTAVGMGVQKAAGDIVIPGMRKLWNTATGGVEAYPALALSDKIMTDVEVGNEGLSLPGLWELSKHIDEGKGLLDLDTVRGAPQSEAMRRYYNALAKHAFKDVPIEQSNTVAGQAAMQRYTMFHDEMKQMFARTNAQYRDQISTSLGDWSQQYDDVLKRYPIDETKEINTSLLETKTRPDGSVPLGAERVDARDMATRIRDKFLDNRGVTNVREADAIGSWNKFKDLFRETQESDALGIARIASTGDNVDDLFSDISVAELVRARRRLADQLEPGVMNRGDTITKTEASNYMEFMKLLDDEIDGIVDGAYGKTKKSFSASMRVQEAFDLGQKYHSGRGISSNDPKKFAQFYNKNLDEIKEAMSPDEWTSFTAGYKRDLQEKLGERGGDYQLKLQLGSDTDKAYATKEGGYEDFVKVLGKDNADEFVKLATEAKGRIDISDKLREMLPFKMSTDEANEFIGAANKWAKKGGFANIAGEQDQNNLILAAMRRFAKKPSEQARVDKMMELSTLRGQELANFIEKSVRAATKIPTTIGVRAAMTQPIDIQNYLDDVEAEENGSQ